MDLTTVSGLGVAAAVLAVSTGVGLWRRRRDGVVRPANGRPANEQPAGQRSAGEPVEEHAGEHAELLAGLGVVPGTPVTLVQFSSAFCAPCRATRLVCGEVAATIDGVRHVEVDAESHLDAVRELGIWRTPTVLVVDAAGAVVGRATGRPTRAQVVAAVAALNLPPRSPSGPPPSPSGPPPLAPAEAGPAPLRAYPSEA